jgi:uncharacterized membrane protein YsdA (DUF1294 family)
MGGAAGAGGDEVMFYMAVAIVLVAILFLIDRNHAWAKMWKIFKWSLAIIVALTILGGTGLFHQRRKQSERAKRQSLDDDPNSRRTLESHLFNVAEREGKIAH